MKEYRNRMTSSGWNSSMSDVAAHRERVQVVVRCRALLPKEIADGRKSCVNVDTVNNTIQVQNFKQADQASKMFTFDRTYDSSSTQRHLYDNVAHPIVHSVMCGYNGTILAYGQTASGKTFTMDGPDEPPELRGIMANAFEDIFAHIQQSQRSDNFLVRASYLEIYNEEVRDLLVGPNTWARLDLKENVEGGVYVKNLTSATVQSVADINRLLASGKKNRSVGATLMNQESSRSHSIFTVTVESSARETSTDSLDRNNNSHSHVRVGKLNLVDLAGSERLKKTGASGDRFKELTNINWSLSALGNVISALVDGKSKSKSKSKSASAHIPYRESKLTRLLQDSLGGNTRTVMIANIGPADYNYEESISTLRYANRAKNIKNKPQINEDPKDVILCEFQEEIARLKEQLEASQPTLKQRSEKVIGFPCTEDYVQHHQMQQLRAKMQQDMESEVSLHKSISEQAMACVKADLEREAQLEMGALKAQKERSEEEKQRIAEQLLQQHAELQSQHHALAREKEDRDVLAAKLQALEEKLIHGSKNDIISESLLERGKQKERQLALREQQLQEKEYLDEERDQKIAELEEAQLMVEDKCNTMEEEVEMKTRKLRKLMTRYQQNKNEVAAVRTELQDTVHEFQRERADIFLSLRSFDQQLQLKTFIIERFIPPGEVSKVTKRLYWDDDNRSWHLQKIIQTLPSSQGGSCLYVTNGITKQPLPQPPSIVGCNRPTCRQTLQVLSQGDRDPRYLVDNILKLELDMPERSTYDYDNPGDRARAEVDVELALSEFDDDGPHLSNNFSTPAHCILRPKSARVKHLSRPSSAMK